MIEGNPDCHHLEPQALLNYRVAMLPPCKIIKKSTQPYFKQIPESLPTERGKTRLSTFLCLSEASLPTLDSSGRFFFDFPGRGQEGSDCPPTASVWPCSGWVDQVF